MHVRMQKGWSGAKLPPSSLCQSCQCAPFISAGTGSSTGSRLIADRPWKRNVGPIRRESTGKVAG